MKKFLLNKLILLEIFLFPWINVSDIVKIIFFSLIIVNSLLWIFSNLGFLKNLIFDKIEIYVIIFLLITLINPLSYWSDLSLENPVLRVFVFLIRFISLRDFRIEDSIISFNILTITTSILSLAGWIFFEMGDSWRLTFPYGDPNYIGFIFGVYFLVTLKYFGDKFSLISVFSLTLSFAVLIATGSRGSFLAIAIIIFLYILKSLFIDFKFKYLIFTITLIFFLQKPITNYVTNLVIYERIYDPRKSDIGALNSRFVEVDKSIEYFKNKPYYLILGNGLSASSNKKIFNNEVRIHNTFAAILFEQGLVGIFFLILILFEIIKYTKKNKGYFLLFFVFMNSLSLYIITNYFLYVCIRILLIKKK